MDEQKNQQTANVSVPDYTNEINAMYDAQRQQQLQSLENAYNQNTQTLQSARANIAPTYNKQANDLNAQYERSRMNNNMQAAANGINTGVGSQMALAQQSNYLDAFGNIRSQQARAEQDLDQQLANLEINYKNSVSQALANNDHERAAALMAEYKRRDEAAKEQQRYNDNWALNKAQTLAQYGNFSGYAELYGQDVADAMQQYFNMMNGGGSSGRGGGGSYSSSGGDNGNGPGTYGNDNGNVETEFDDTEMMNAYYRYLNEYGGDKARAAAQVRNDYYRKMREEAKKAAAKAGIKPEGAGYAAFMDAYLDKAASENPAYRAAMGMTNALAADVEAERQAKKSEQKKAETKAKVEDFATKVYEQQTANDRAVEDFWWRLMHPQN